MAVSALQLPQQGAINSLVDWSPLQKIADKVSQKRQDADAADKLKAYLDTQQQQPVQQQAPLSTLGQAYAGTPVGTVARGPDLPPPAGATATAPLPGEAPAAPPAPQPSPQLAAAPQQPPQQFPPLSILQRINQGFAAANGQPPPFDARSSATTTNSNDVLDAGLRVIKQKESSGDYSNVTDAGKGRKVYGAYGILDENIPTWTQQALGHAMTPDEFLHDQQAQDATARYKFGQYANKYGMTGAAKAWLGGEGGMNNPNAADRFGTTVSAYADDFNSKLPAEITTGRSRPDQSSPQAMAFDTPHARALDNLQRPDQPASSAGVGRDELIEMFKNPTSRPLAQALLQKQLEPGSYTFQQVGDRLVRTNNKTGATDVVMSDTKPIQVDPDKPIAIPDPSAPGGYRYGPPPGGASKALRESQARYQVAKSQNASDEEARYFATYGKPLKDELAPDERKQVNTLTDMASSGQDVLDNIETLKTLSPKAYSGYGALPRAEATSLLPDFLQSQRAIDTQNLANTAHQNVALTAKSIFGNRITNADLKLLDELESSANQPDAVRQDIYKRVGRMVQNRVNQAKDEAGAIRGGTFYKRDYQPPERLPTGQQTGPQQATPPALDRAALETEMRKRGLLK